MKYLIAQEFGCVYRVSPDTHLVEWAPLYKDNTFDSEEFGDVELELVGEERVTFHGVETNIYGVVATVKMLLDKSA